MFESEIYYKTHIEDLPIAVRKKFEETLAQVELRSVLHWTEHCTECAMPACFKTCSLYSPRTDGKCARFVNGIQPLEAIPSSSHRILKIQFKQWGVLATQGNNHLKSRDAADKLEKNDLKVASLINKSPAKSLRKKLIQKRYSIKKNDIRKHLQEDSLKPDFFILECFNPLEKKVILNLTIRSEDSKYRKLPFQFKVVIEPGYNREEIPFTEIEKRVRTGLNYRINITPEGIAVDHALYFGLLEFVKFKNVPTGESKKGKVKCIVWDLDNTIWHGILTEGSVKELSLRKNIRKIISDLEEKGVIHSIASKNNPDSAIAALEYFGLQDFFVFPKISWQPKSQSIRELVRDLNISPGTLMFIDDSDFERQEVKSVFPQLKVLDALEIEKIPDMDFFQTAATAESKNRKNLYLDEQKRKGVADDFEGEYLEFLKSCQMKLELLKLEEIHFERVYELTQRTNQMNFSGSKYKESDIENIATSTHLDNFVMSCSDKFGNYGIVGFAIVDTDKNTLVDLMFSCRIQSKRVEHAFFYYCLQYYLPQGDFRVKYKRTDRNKFSAQVFDDLNFELEKKEDNIHTLIFKTDRPVSAENIVEIIT